MVRPAKGDGARLTRTLELGVCLAALRITVSFSGPGPSTVRSWSMTSVLDRTIVAGSFNAKLMISPGGAGDSLAQGAGTVVVDGCHGPHGRQAVGVMVGVLGTGQWPCSQPVELSASHSRRWRKPQQGKVPSRWNKG